MGHRLPTSYACAWDNASLTPVTALPLTPTPNLNLGPGPGPDPDCARCLIAVTLIWSVSYP